MNTNCLDGLNYSGVSTKEIKRDETIFFPNFWGSHASACMTLYNTGVTLSPPLCQPDLRICWTMTPLKALDVLCRVCHHKRRFTVRARL